MDQNFQTSFIPKKPIVEEKRPVGSSSSVGLFSVISIFIFFTMAVGTGGLYFYKISQEKRLKSMQDDLVLARNRFEPSRIADLKVLDKRLSAATTVLNNHVAVSPIFQALGDLTMKSVRYTKFSYTLNEGKVNVKMSGQAVGYRSIALQADLLSKSKYFLDPVFSNLQLDNKGNVLFELVFSVSHDFVDYAQMLKTENANTGDVTRGINTNTNTNTTNTNTSN